MDKHELDLFAVYTPSSLHTLMLSLKREILIPWKGLKLSYFSFYETASHNCRDMLTILKYEI